MTRPMFIKLKNSINIISTDGLRGVQAFREKDTMDEKPYIEFRYDGGTTMQVGFKDDIELLSYLAALADTLDVVEISNEMKDVYLDKRVAIG